MNRAFIVVIVAQACALHALASSSRLQFTSDPGSWIGQGQSFSVAPADGYVFTSRVLDPSGIEINVESTLSIFDPDYHYWNLWIGAPSGSSFDVGTYVDAERYSFATPGHPRLDFTGDYRGSNTLTGYFTVYEIAFNLSGELTRFVADFTQYEDGNTTKGVYGHIEFDASAAAPADLPALSMTGMGIFLGVIAVLGLIKARKPVHHMVG